MQIRCPRCKKIVTEHSEECKDIKWFQCSCGFTWENKEYEKLYSLLKFDDTEKHYFFENDLKDFDELITNLKKKMLN